MGKEEPRLSLLIKNTKLTKIKLMGGSTTPDFRLHSKKIVMKTTWYWNDKRHVNHWTTVKDSNIKLHFHCHLQPIKGKLKGRLLCRCWRIKLWNLDCKSSLLLAEPINITLSPGPRFWPRNQHYTLERWQLFNKCC